MPCDDCSRTESCPPCPEDGKCRCGPDEACGDCPEAPEEHNLGPDGVGCVFDACPRDPDDCEHGCRAAADELSREASEMEPPPPQPDRRPPYAVAYSVQGHLYEVALPGDAAAQAVDGVLVIRHHLGPVAGIVQVLPVLNERSADGAEADQ